VDAADLPVTRVLVAGWVGSTNLGDELVLAGLLRHLTALGATPVPVSVDPAGTRAVHGVDAVGVRDVPAATRAAGAVVLGGGGLLQDETSPFNLPYHLGRTAPARALRRPVAGIGLGAGRLTTRAGRALVRAALRGVPLTVRDAPSADLLAACGLPRPAVTADLALALPAVAAVPQDRLVVCLRPWSGGGGRLPVGLRRTPPAADAPALDRTAAELDAVAEATGLAVHLVALQADRDGPLHDAVAGRMRTPATTARPDLAALPAEVASGRVVLAQRYHGGICAVLVGRPVVLVGYSPKVDALAGELGPAARLLPWSPRGLAGAVDAVQAVAGASSVEGRNRLRERESGNRRALEHLLERVQPR
jgi:polysaccharide pyruvyl transferase CsaB